MCQVQLTVQSARFRRAATLSTVWCVVFLSLLCLVLYLPGIARIPPWDRDEAVYAQGTKEMIETGDFIRPRFHGKGFYKKPIGIYWLQAAMALAVNPSNRTRIWVYRIPSVAGALAAVLTTFWIGSKLFGNAVALLGASLLATSVVLVVEAALASTDAVLLACVTWAQGCLAALYLWPARCGTPPWGYAAQMWIALGLGILVKGPVIVGVVGLTVIALAVWERLGVDKPFSAEGRKVHLFERSGWWWGIPLMAAIVMPWAIAIGRATHNEFYRESFFGDIWPKLVGGQEGHFAPPGYYAASALITFWPGSLLAGAAVWNAFQRRTEPYERLLLAWLIPCWVAFELAPTKLPHYTLPTYPALALLTARFACDPAAGSSRLVRVEGCIWGVATLLGATVIVSAPIVLGHGLSWLSSIPCGALVFVALTATRLSVRGNPVKAAWVAVLSTVLIVPPLRLWVIPSLNSLWVSRSVAEAVSAQERACKCQRPLATVGYREPSLIFLLGTQTQILGPKEAVAFLQSNPQGLVLVTGPLEQAFLQAARRKGLLLEELWSTSGINYTKGIKLTLKLFARRVTTSYLERRKLFFPSLLKRLCAPIVLPERLWRR